MLLYTKCGRITGKKKQTIVATENKRREKKIEYKEQKKKQKKKERERERRGKQCKHKKALKCIKTFSRKI